MEECITISQQNLKVGIVTFKHYFISKIEGKLFIL